MPELVVSPDERRATLVLAPGERITSPRALAFLARRGVRCGHVPPALATLPDLEGPCEVVVAEAEDMRPGADAYIAMPTGNMAFAYGPAMGDGGWPALPPPLPVAVVPGDVVAERVPAEPARPARTVTGKPLGRPPAEPRDVALVAGPGTALAPDGRVVAAIAGNAALEDGHVVVRPEYRIAGDLTFEAGDVEFDGNVLVLGDVAPGRAIVATGDVTVAGVAVGARLDAGRRIVVHGGVRQQAVLRAGTDVIAQFVEGSQVVAGGLVVVREDLTQAHVVEARALVAGGSVVGGQVQVHERLEADALGSAMAPPTRVAVVPPPPPADPRPALVAERKELAATSAQVRMRIEEAQRVVARLGAERQKGQEALEMLEKLAELARGLVARDAGLEARIAAATAEAPPPIRPSLHVRSRIHPGVAIQLGPAQLRVDSEYPAGSLWEARGAVQVGPLEPRGCPA